MEVITSRKESSVTVATIQVIVNGNPTEIEANSSILDLLEKLDIPGRGIAVEVNRELVPRGDHDTFELSENDQLEVVSLAGGG